MKAGERFAVLEAPMTEDLSRVCLERDRLRRESWPGGEPSLGTGSAVAGGAASESRNAFALSLFSKMKGLKGAMVEEAGNRVPFHRDLNRIISTHAKRDTKRERERERTYLYYLSHVHKSPSKSGTGWFLYYMMVRRHPDQGK